MEERKRKILSQPTNQIMRRNYEMAANCIPTPERHRTQEAGGTAEREG